MELKVHKAPEFLAQAHDADAKEAAQVNLDEVTKQVKLLIDARSEIDRIEEELKVAKEEERRLSGEVIPQLINSAGLSKITLLTGEEIKVKEDVSVSVPPEKEAAFYKWLADRKEDDIVKLHVAFSRMAPEKQKELLEFLTLYDYDFDVKKGVHSSTLAKYFRELLGAGDPNREEGVKSGLYKRKEDVEGIANVFLIHKTIVD